MEIMLNFSYRIDDGKKKSNEDQEFIRVMAKTAFRDTLIANFR